MELNFQFQDVFTVDFLNFIGVSMIVIVKIGSRETGVK